MTRLAGVPSVAAFALVAVIACDGPVASPTAAVVTMATGGPGGAFYPLGLALARHYDARIDGIETRVESGTSGENVRAVQAGRAQIAFTQADVAYLAYRFGTEGDRTPYAELRGIAVLWMNTVQLVVPRGSRLSNVADLAGRRVSVGTRGSGTETLAHIVLQSYGLDYTDLAPDFASFVRSVETMRAGTTDAAFVVAGVPTVAIADLAARPGVRLLAIPRAHVRTMRGPYPFLQPLVVPRGTYPGQDEAIDTVGVSSLLVCRRDVDEQFAYRLTRELFEALPEFSRTHPTARLIDPGQAPATPIPLHPGAARYYREREILQ